MALPIFNTKVKEFSMMQTQWASAIDPIIDAPQSKSLILKNVPLISGTTTINTLLGRKLQGWKIIRQRAAASIYDQQDSNPSPALTLILVSSAAVMVDLEIF